MITLPLGIDQSKGIYYYTTYENRQITAVSLQNEDLSGNQLIRFSLPSTQEIKIQNPLEEAL